MKNRIAVIHGVNLDRLGERNPLVYGPETLLDLETQVTDFASEIGLEAVCHQTNHEGELVEYIHELRETADALLVNAGAWTHYSYAIRDAIEFTGLPFAEVHISDVMSREKWRHHSVFADIPARVIEVHGKGIPGYREALIALRDRLQEG